MEFTPREIEFYVEKLAAVEEQKSTETLAVYGHQFDENLRSLTSEGRSLTYATARGTQRYIGMLAGAGIELTRNDKKYEEAFRAFVRGGGIVPQFFLMLTEPSEKESILGEATTVAGGDMVDQVDRFFHLSSQVSLIQKVLEEDPSGFSFLESLTDIAVLHPSAPSYGSRADATFERSGIMVGIAWYTTLYIRGVNLGLGPAPKAP